MSTVTSFIPKIGMTWITAGGCYAGPCAHGHLIIGTRVFEPLPWADAIGWARSRSYAGHTDWDLPSIAQLRQIHDAFKWFPISNYWSRESVNADDAMLWIAEPRVTTHYAKRFPNTALCVRVHSIN